MNNPYHFKPNELLQRREPSDLGLAYTSVQRLELDGAVEIESGGEELCLVVIGGAARFCAGKRQGEAVCRDMLYVPRHCRARLEGARAVVMQYGAPADRDADFAHITFAGVDANPDTHKVFGKTETNCRRDVWNFIGAEFNCSRLMMGMCLGRPGGWTSWPPHEHGSQREEVYVYFGMGEAFGVQCVYDDMDDPYTVAMVRDGDLISVPRGYHPNAGCPGGAIGFVYCMTATTPGKRDFMDLTIQKEFGDRFE